MQSVYDSQGFFERYQKLRSNPKSLNEVVEKPTMLTLLPDLKGKSLLDLGCGCGEHLQLYLQHGADSVIGLDLSKSMLQQAQSELNQLQIESSTPNFSLYNMAMEDLEQLQDGPFDLITSSFALHYVADLRALLSKISAKLKSNGYFIFSQEHPIVTCYQGGERWEKDQNKRQLAYRLSHYGVEGVRQRNWFQQPFQTYHRTLASIINSLIEAGFQIEKVVEPTLMGQPQWQQEFQDLQHRPVLLFIKVRKT